jgi:hypothetical protein
MSKRVGLVEKRFSAKSIKRADLSAFPALGHNRFSAF